MVWITNTFQGSLGVVLGYSFKSKLDLNIRTIQQALKMTTWYESVASKEQTIPVIEMNNDQFPLIVLSWIVAKATTILILN